MLCSFNLQSTFTGYSFYNPAITPVIIGAIIAVLSAYCLFGGEKMILKITTAVVPFMGLSYVAVALIVITLNYSNIPAMFLLIFQDAFNLQSILGGVAGSCLVYGIKRGLFSNEAGVGSAPNASASANVSHPVKQGLVQTLSVYIDTLLLCTATALMCLSTGIARGVDVSGAPYVQNAVGTVFGTGGPIFITVAMVLFAFTTLIGNLYYVDNALIMLNNEKKPSERFMKIFNVLATTFIFIGAIIPMDAAWAIAGYGVRVVISSSFADIHRNNLLNCFVLPVVVTKEFQQELFDTISKNPEAKVIVDVPNQIVTNKETGHSEYFEINGYKKYCLMNALDDIDFLLENKEKIETYEQQK